MTFKLPELPYTLDALEPVISKKTLEFHYGKHHQTYVDKLNGLIKGTEFENADIETIVKSSQGGIFNNAAQVWNHTFYFSSFSPKGGGEPSGELASALNSAFGSFEHFKVKFADAAATLFGSGWAWLVKNKEGKLEIVQESNAGNPMCKGLTPLLTCDVWEHAYYLDYQNKRPEYIEKLWDLIDWKVIESRF
ncbi:superoxide dismutase [Alkalitalea saponilacus]|uniref:Superoxide dismutase n=1 Tax=Alkalitalea saponilacus TaxID=889453 RepID=A0A1T5BY64_9BACT|nr:superoxide dismutase [Alkalitalea saponilacus]ASB49547.1 superoxide dismutase [Alkalitalea saponilacus]SKB52094.1 superoxide dismutase, Fe-Mn family [Alkalitalea saponilacus]